MSCKPAGHAEAALCIGFRAVAKTPPGSAQSVQQPRQAFLGLGSHELRSLRQGLLCHSPSLLPFLLLLSLKPTPAGCRDVPAVSGAQLPWGQGPYELVHGQIILHIDWHVLGAAIFVYMRTCACWGRRPHSTAYISALRGKAGLCR
ncbi:hypothetical protein XENOCAPTIV_029328 [Xenoophorus captivus]|uniref:Uncharacterized protein n=1 Tax=Xenoophorus captivus TaxID=1517983 RepID=A0ABV0R2S3_9TELE